MHRNEWGSEWDREEKSRLRKAEQRRVEKVELVSAVTAGYLTLSRVVMHPPSLYLTILIIIFLTSILIVLSPQGSQLYVPIMIVVLLIVISIIILIIIIVFKFKLSYP